MEVELFNLLSTQKIAHPSRVVSAVFADDELRVVIAGHAWWTPSPEPGDHQLDLVFGGLVEGKLDLAGRQG